MKSPPHRIAYELVSLLMLLLLTGASTISFASSDNSKAPDRCVPVPCGSTYKWSFYDNPSSGGTVNGYSSGYTVGPYSCLSGKWVGITAEPNPGYGFKDWSGGTLGSSTTTNPNSLYVPCPGSDSVTANYIVPSTLSLWNWTDDTFDMSSKLPSFSSFSSNATVSASGMQSHVYLSQSPCFNNLTLSAYTANGTMPGYNVFYDSYCYWDGGSTYSGNVTIDISMIQNTTTHYWVSTMSADFFLPTGQVNAGDLLNQSYTSTLGYLLDHQEVNGYGGGLIQELATVGANYESRSNSTLKTQGGEYVSLSDGLTDFENVLSNHDIGVLDMNIEGYIALVDDYVPNLVCSAIFGAEIVGVFMFPEEIAAIATADSLSAAAYFSARLLLPHFFEQFASSYYGCF